MATGWAGDGAVQQQIDDSIADAIERARAQLPAGRQGQPAALTVASGAPCL